MKSLISDPDHLDKLAAGLDAGWDDEPVQASPSQPPHSTPLPESLDALDADWDDAIRSQPATTPSTTARGTQRNPSPARGSQSRTSATRAGTPPPVAAQAQVRASKQERREADRKRRVHQAQQNSATKKERKAERQAAARRASEERMAREQQALAERRARQPRAPTRSEPEDRTRAEKRSEKRVRREATAPVKPPPSVAPVLRTAPRVQEERTLSKLVPIVLIALVLALSLGFALSRAR
jgi:hypothetical protein